MTTECAALGRTSADGYEYACTPAGFASGLHYQCEIGDIASKLGTLIKESSGSGDVIFSGSDTDPFPPAPINFGNASAAIGICTSWLSFVAHCPSSGERLVCAKFQTTTCSDSSSSSSDDELSSLELAGIIVGASLGMALLVVFCFVYILGFRAPADGEKQKMLEQL
jgi:hypothetical protein